MVNNMTSHKDKLEDMDVSLIKESVRAVAITYRNFLIATGPQDMHHFLGYEMEDLDIVFPRIQCGSNNRYRFYFSI